MPFLGEAVKNDSFPLPMTAGSENPDFWTKNNHTYVKSDFGDYILISANDPSQKCVLPLLLHILI